MLGKYENDKWLTDWSENGWAVGYHGISRKESKIKKIMNNILKVGLQPGVITQGFYIFPSPRYLDYDKWKLLYWKIYNHYMKGVYFAS